MNDQAKDWMKAQFYDVDRLVMRMNCVPGLLLFIVALIIMFLNDVDYNFATVNANERHFHFIIAFASFLMCLVSIIMAVVASNGFGFFFRIVKARSIVVHKKDPNIVLSFPQDKMISLKDSWGYRIEESFIHGVESHMCVDVVDVCSVNSSKKVERTRVLKFTVNFAMNAFDDDASFMYREAIHYNNQNLVDGYLIEAINKVIACVNDEDKGRLLTMNEPHIEDQQNAFFCVMQEMINPNVEKYGLIVCDTEFTIV